MCTEGWSVGVCIRMCVCVHAHVCVHRCMCVVHPQWCVSVGVWRGVVCGVRVCRCVEVCMRV